MTTLKLHYDGWLALPADFRRKLGLGKGQALEAQLVGGTIVLRPAGGKAAEALEAEPEPAPAVMEQATAEAPAKPRARRKQAAQATTTTALPPALKSRGRKARAADGAQGS